MFGAYGVFFGVYGASFVLGFWLFVSAQGSLVCSAFGGLSLVRFRCLFFLALGLFVSAFGTVALGLGDVFCAVGLWCCCLLGRCVLGRFVVLVGASSGGRCRLGRRRGFPCWLAAESFTLGFAFVVVAPALGLRAVLLGGLESLASAWVRLGLVPLIRSRTCK